MATLKRFSEKVINIVKTNCALYGTIIYVFIIIVVVMFFYLKTYKGVVKNYCASHQGCHDSMDQFTQIGAYLALATLTYLLYVGTKTSFTLAIIAISGMIGWIYMADAWKVTIDGAVYDETADWTVCRLILKYAPYNPTIAQRMRIIMPLMVLVMFFSFMHLLAAVGFSKDEYPYFVIATILVVGFIGRKTFLFVKY